MKIFSQKIIPVLFAITLGSATQVYAHEGHDPLLTHVIIDQLEWRKGDGNDLYALEMQGWIGKDLNKLWIKTDIDSSNSHLQHVEVQALYGRAISPYWDLQLGIRQDSKPNPKREWGVIGIQGLAPYHFDISAALFVGESGRSAARISAEYDLLFTQRLILSPSLTMNFYGQNDSQYMNGSGLSDAQAGLRLRYEVRREFAPYIGVNWSRNFGNSADYLREQGETTHESEWVVGIRAWF